MVYGLNELAQEEKGQSTSGSELQTCYRLTLCTCLKWKIAVSLIHGAFK